MTRCTAMMAVLVCLTLRPLLHGAPPSDLPRILDEAERIRSEDKPRSRRLLDEVNRSLAAKPDDGLLARAQLLECRWADQPEVAYRAVDAGLPAAVRVGSVSLRAKLISCRALARSVANRHLEAERDYEDAAALARLAKDPALEADSLLSLGELQYDRGAMADALASLQRAYRMNESLAREKPRLDALTAIANVYADSQVAQYDRAIEYYRQLVGEYEKHGKPSDVADTLFNLGGTYETKGDFAAAEQHYRRALAVFQKIGKPSDAAFTKRALGSSIMKQSRVREALPWFDAALAYYERERDRANVALVHQFRGMAYRRMGRSAEALHELEAARLYYQGERNVRYLERNADEVGRAQAQLGHWREAYEASRKHAALQQELATSRRDEASSRLRVEFDAEKKEQENRALARENALRVVALKSAERGQKMQLIVIVLTALLATTLAVLFWRQLVHSRRMRTMALTDELTRLPNRRHIFAAAEEAFVMAKKKSQPMTIVAFDIDHFKRINDSLGHPAGDTVLQRVARTCRLALRPTDQVGRTGGEEFMLVLRDTTPEQAREIAERLRAAVEAIDFSDLSPGLRVTISLGGAGLTDQDSLSAICSTADTLLYRAKDGGRNRVEFALP